MIKVLIVDDSATEAAILRNILSAEPDMEIIAYAKNGKEGFELANKLRPNVITMDIQMPVMDGFEATRLIMSTCPAPIVVISSKAADQQMNTSFRALEAGALSVLGKLVDVMAPNFEREAKRIVDTVRSMSEIKPITRRYPKTVTKRAPEKLQKDFASNQYELIAMGASVGGPPALKNILAQLPQDFPLPIVVVQHIAEGFINGFVNWMNNDCQLKIKVAEHQEELKGGVVYFAPDHRHLAKTQLDALPSLYQEHRNTMEF